MSALGNAVAARSRMASEGSRPRIATVIGYDPDAYAVKVKIEPQGVPSGWIPLASEWVGNGWGLFAPPSLGDQVELLFQEGDFEAPYAGKRFFSDADRPVSVPSGEFWLVHKSGSWLKFLNSGAVEIKSAGNLTATVGGNASVEATGTVTIKGSMVAIQP